MKKIIYFILICILIITNLGSSFANEKADNRNTDYTITKRVYENGIIIKQNMRKEVAMDTESEDGNVNRTSITKGDLDIHIVSISDKYIASGTMKLNNEIYTVNASGNLEVVKINYDNYIATGIFIGTIISTNGVEKVVTLDIQHNLITKQTFVSSVIGMLNSMDGEMPIMLEFGEFPRGMREFFEKESKKNIMEKESSNTSQMDISQTFTTQEAVPHMTLRSSNKYTSPEGAGDLVYIASYHPLEATEGSTVGMWVRAWANSTNLLKHFEIITNRTSGEKYINNTNQRGIYEVYLTLLNEQHWNSFNIPDPRSTTSTVTVPLPYFWDNTWQIKPVTLLMSSTNYQRTISNNNFGNHNQARWHFQHSALNSPIANLHPPSTTPWTHHSGSSGIGAGETFAYRATPSGSFVNNNVNAQAVVFISYWVEEMVLYQPQLKRRTMPVGVTTNHNIRINKR